MFDFWFGAGLGFAVGVCAVVLMMGVAALMGASEGDE